MLTEPSDAIDETKMPDPSPIAVGGLGGSGTRVVAKVLTRLGFYMGSDLNRQMDNLWFTFLFKRLKSLELSSEAFSRLTAVLIKRMSTRAPLTSAERQLVRRLAVEPQGEFGPFWRWRRAWTLAHSRRDTAVGLWGWKEPNTHVVLGRLVEAVPQLRYLNVARNGLDMAHSGNQSQVRFWQRIPRGELTPLRSLRYWCQSTQNTLSVGATMDERFFFLNFDRFCENTESELDRLANFLEVSPSAEERRALLDLVHVPPSTGRFKEHGTHIFDPGDVDFVRSLGFNCDVAGS